MEDTPPAHQVRVTGGYNDFDFSWPLAPGESLSTPPYYGGFSSHGFGEASRLLHRFERDEILPDRAASARAAGALQLLGSDGVQRQRGGAEGPGREGRQDRRRTLRDGRRLVRQAQRRPRRPGRLVREPAEVSQRAQAAHQLREQPGHGFWPVVRAGDGEPRQRPLPPASRLGDELSRTAAQRGSQPARPEHGARGCEGIHLRRARQDAVREQHQVHQVGHEPALRRAGLAGGAPRRSRRKSG